MGQWAARLPTCVQGARVLGSVLTIPRYSCLPRRSSAKGSGLKRTLGSTSGGTLARSPYCAGVRVFGLPVKENRPQTHGAPALFKRDNGFYRASDQTLKQRKDVFFGVQ